MHLGDFRRPDEGATRMDELDSELWHACAGPLTSLPPVGSLVMYYPQGHIEQVIACMPDKGSAEDVHTAAKGILKNVPSGIPCKISKIELQADPQTDEVFAAMDLAPQHEKDITKEMMEAPTPSKQKNVRMFCKTLTASDTSTHGGFSVPRRAAEECLPLLDYNMNPPCQELVAKDLHGREWNFRHIYRGHPRRHLLTTGWSVFVSQKRLVAGDTVIFLRGENGQLRVGVRRAMKQQPQARSTFFSTTNLHLGVLAAASHAAAEHFRFSVIYNPRTSPSEFVIPYHKVVKAVENTSLSVGSRFKMKFESEDSSERRYAGTIIEISDCEPEKWPLSKWRSMKVEWDESAASERHERVSPWEIELFVPISSLPPPPAGPRLKRRPPTLVTDLSPLGPSQSVLNSFQSNKLARIHQVPDIPNETSMGDEDDEDAESSRASSRVVCKQEQRRTGPPSWFPYDSPVRDLVQLSPNSSFEQAPGSDFTSGQWPTPWTFQSGAPFRLPTPSKFPAWLTSPKFPPTGADSQTLSLEMRDKGEKEILNNGIPPVEQKCKLFGFNLKQPRVADSAPIHSEDSEGSGAWPPAPDHSSQHASKLGVSQGLTRTGTKVSQQGKVGRTIDLKKCESYVDLRRMLASLFNLEGQLDDAAKGWQLVYTDHENDVLLVGDDPWEEFCSCVRSLKILSPADAAGQSVGKQPTSSLDFEEEWGVS